MEYKKVDRMRQLDDFKFTDELILLSHTYVQIQEKTKDMNNESKRMGLQIHEDNTSYEVKHNKQRIIYVLKKMN